MSIAAVNWAFRMIEACNLTATERLVLLALAHRENSKTRRCDPSMAAIARMTGVTRPKVSSAVQSLASKSLLSIENRKTSAGQISNSYRLGGVPSAEQGGCSLSGTGPCSGGDTPGGVPSAEHNKGSITSKGSRASGVVVFPSQKIGNGGGNV